MMKQLFAGLCAVALLSLISPLTPVQAQTAAIETRHAEPYYDITREVTLTGTVSSVVKQPSAGMIMGSHLVLETSSGSVDASLGKWGFQGKGALSVAAGEQVEVTGVMKTINGNQVFLARTVKANGQVYPIRNEHGIQVSPQARERMSQNTDQKGDTL
jgi:hypothetical protein